MISGDAKPTASPPTDKQATPAGADKATPSSIAVTITSAGELFLGGSAVKDADLEARLRAHDTSKQLIIHADKAAPHARVVLVTDTAKKVGFTKLAIATSPTDPKTTPPSKSAPPPKTAPPPM
jgi:biopolymer transport protein ExbD